MLLFHFEATTDKQTDKKDYKERKTIFVAENNKPSEMISGISEDIMNAWSEP